jgi:hypothetical protein
MARSSKLLVAMQGKGVFVIDLAERSVVSGLRDCIVVAPGPDNGETFFAGTDKGQHKSTDGGRSWQLKGLEQYKIFSLAFHPSDPKTIYAVNGATPRRRTSRISKASPFIPRIRK